MAMRKSRNKMSDYWRRGHLLPFIPWLYDIVMPIALALVIVIASAGVFSEVRESQASLQRIQEEPVEYVPYQEIEPTKSLGREWAETFIKTPPPSVTNWTVSDSTNPQHAINPKYCTYLKELPSSLTSTHVASGEGTETRIQIYAPGQATKNLHEIATKIFECEKGIIEATETATIVQFDYSFIFSMGDAIVSVRTVNNTVRDEMLNHYLATASESLTKSECIALRTTLDDANRNYFYNPEEYVGLYETTHLTTNISLDNIPVPTSVAMVEILDKNATEPESPLPETFEPLPTPMDRPLAPAAVETVENFEKDAAYLIADLDGPGCGWAWAGQEHPIYDFEKLEQEKIDTITRTQIEVDTDAKNYVNAKIRWAFQVGLLSSEINDWNKYVNKTNEIHAEWEWLKEERRKLRGPWREYVSEHRWWQGFDERKADAVRRHEAAVAECVAKENAYQDWETQWRELWDAQQEYLRNPPAPPAPPETQEPTQEPTDGPTSDESATPDPEDTQQPTAPPTATQEPTQTPTPTVDPIATMNIPAPPQRCETPPNPPAIINETKPAEPQPPTVPEGVTIPDSWDRP